MLYFKIIESYLQAKIGHMAHVIESVNLSKILHGYKSADFEYSHNYIVGAFLVNDNHWNAMVIDCARRRFYLLDPLKSTRDFAQKCLANWCFGTAKTQQLELTEIPHPLQQDSINCGPIVCWLIENIVFSGSVPDILPNMRVLRDSMDRFLKDSSTL